MFVGYLDFAVVGVSAGGAVTDFPLGGFIIAGLFAQAIRTQIPALSKSIVHPTKAIGENMNGSLMFTVDGTGKFKCDSEYWTGFTQKMLDGIKPNQKK